jgi:glycosyltransferase involved in cell wall biosynthesis
MKLRPEGLTKMEIVYIGPMRLPIPSEKGAVEDIIWQLAKRLSAKESVQIFNPLRPKHNKIQSFLCTSSLVPWSWGRAPVIHSHNPYASLALLSPTADVKNHLVTLHYPPWISDRAVENKIFMMVLKTLDLFGVKLTVPNIYIRDWLETKGIESVYLPNGVDTDTFNPSHRDETFRSRLLGNRADLLLVSLGRIDDTKNQLMLLRSFNDVLKANPRLKLVLVGPKSGTFQEVGTSSYASRVQSFIQEKGLAGNVEWLGEVGMKRDVARILASCDIYVHPSKVEAAPLAILEAMASGLPIVAFDLPWYKGYLTNGTNATLCSYSTDALTECLSSMAASGVDEAKRTRQHELAKNFSWDVLIADYKKQYEAK